MRRVANKKRIMDALEGLADDATIDEAIERLCFLAKVEKGISQLDADECLDHEEVRRRFEP